MPQTGKLASWLQAELEGSINTAPPPPPKKTWASSTHSPVSVFVHGS